MTYYQHHLQATEKEHNALLATSMITDCEAAKIISNVLDLPRSVVQQQVA